MNLLFMKPINTVKGLLIVGLLLLAPAAYSSVVEMNFDSVNAGNGVDATSYLASYGVTLSNVSLGAVDIFSDQNYYGAGDVAASSPHNFLLQNAVGAPNGSTYTGGLRGREFFLRHGGCANL